MRTWALLLAVCLLTLAVGACGPAPAHHGSLTAGICPRCGSANLDVQSHTERSSFDGAEVEILTMTCRDCGYSWSAPAAIK